MTTERIHSLRDDLARAITIDLMETGTARVYGPEGTANRVVNAIEMAGRTLGENVTWVREARGWLAAVTA